MKFKIKNTFSKWDTTEEVGMFQVTTFDFDKFRDEQIVEFDTEKELCDFLREAQDTIKFVKDHKYDWIEVSVVLNRKNDELVIWIQHEYQD